MLEQTERPSQPLFRQVYDYLTDQISKERWREHEKLPSVRLLAAELGVNRLTVLRAFQLLKESSYVYVKEKSGYYVLPRSQVLSKIKTGARPMSLTESPSPDDADMFNPGIISFAQAIVDPGLLPNRYFSEYAKKVFDLYPKVLGTYSSVHGDPELRSVLAGYFSRTHALFLEPEEILITSGAQQAIDLAARAFVKPGDVVLMERPTYHAAIDMLEHLGAQIASVDIHPWGYDMDEVENHMKRLKPSLFYINPTFHNPTGYTVPVEQRKQLAGLAEQYGCLIVEDDSFRDIYFGDAPPPPVASFDADGWVIYIRSFSKYAAPGLRIAAVCALSSRMKLLLQFKYRMDNGAALLNQKVFLLYLASERLTGHLEKLRIALQLRKQAMEMALLDDVFSGWSWESPTGGLNLWLKLPEEAPSLQRIAGLCAEQQVAFSPGTAHDPLRRMNRHLRLCYSYLKEQEIQKGIEAIKAAVR